jgi:hypothetical protein
MIRFVCLAILGSNLAVVIVGFLTFDGTTTLFGPPPGADFPEFYGAGRILNEFSAHALYDLDLQYRIYHEVLPHSPAHLMLPFLYAPFFALIFRPLAFLPYAWACATWMIISVATYLIGLNLVWRSIESIPSREKRTVYLLALSFQPFLECVLSGQSSVFGFLALALAVRCESLHRPFCAGLCLALCFYKPNLLCLFLPWLVLARKWKALAGVGTGAIALCGVSLLAVGWSGCENYARALVDYPRFVTLHNIAFPRWKFVDVYSFFVLLFGNNTALSRVLWALCVLAVFPWVARSGQGERLARRGQQLLTWCAVLTWTLLLSSHTGLYDVCLIVIGLMITTDRLCQGTEDHGLALPPGFQRLLLLLYVAPWFSQVVALLFRFQPMTLILIALGLFQIRMFRALEKPAREHGDLVSAGPLVRPCS